MMPFKERPGNERHFRFLALHSRVFESWALNLRLIVTARVSLQINITHKRFASLSPSLNRLDGTRREDGSSAQICQGDFLRFTRSDR